MAKFKYSAIDLNGQSVAGTISAANEQEALARLRPSMRLIVSFHEVQESNDIDIGKYFGSGKISEKSLALLCSQLSIILNAGLPVIRAVELVAEQTADKKLREIMQSAADGIGGGRSMADSLERAAEGALPDTFIETIRAGEASGSLVTSLRRLHTYYDRSSKTRAKVKSALIYPIFVIVVAILVVVVVMVVGVPVFRDTFMDMGTELPLITRLLIGISDFFVGAWMWLLILVVGLTAGILIYQNSDMGRIPWAGFQLRIPVLGKLRMLRGCGEFASTLGTLLAAGLPIVEALNITGRTMGNALLGDCVIRAAARVEEGRTVTECLRQDGLFPALLTEMVGVGEESGNIEETLEVVGEYYDTEAATASSRALGLIEPITIVLLGGLVAVILLSVYLPMFGMYAGVG